MFYQSLPGFNLTSVNIWNMASLPIQILLMSVDSLNVIVILTIYWIFYLDQDPRIWKVHKKMLTPKLTTWGKILNRKVTTLRKGKERNTLARYKAISLLALPLLAHSSELGIKSQRNFQVDTDSRHIGIDNRCTACISHQVSDFLPDLERSHRMIKGFGGSRTTNLMVGTLKWSWADDEGKIHSFLIPKSYYVPQGKCRLLSPQHWAKHQRKLSPKFNTGEFTNHKETTLQWEGQGKKCTLTIPLTKDTNVATFSTAPGYSRFEAFCTEIEAVNDEDNVIYAEPSTMVSDDEVEGEGPPLVSADTKTWSESKTPQSIEFDLNGPQEEHEDVTPQGRKQRLSLKSEEDRSSELLKIHQRMGHTPFAKLQIMAQQGILPKTLAKCPIPLCTSCTFAKQTRTPWRGKPKKNTIPRKDLSPGEVVSVDQMVSPTHGFVAQMTGKLTIARYRYATIYVDQATKYGFVYLQKTASAAETLKGKQAWELHAKGMGIYIRAYHADNGVFRANAWVNDCNAKDQALTFAGVNAHHQNGVAERRIRELQGMTRTSMIHASRRWNACITANLWPYALRMASNAFNNSPNMMDKEKKSPLQIFSKSEVTVNPKHFQPFGCPVYVLASALQTQSPYHKWKERSRVGIYLGASPAHGKNVSLVLSRETGLVSPQFHVKHDPLFQSVKQDNFDSKWQEKAGLLTIRKEAPPPKPKAPTGKRKRITIQEVDTPVPNSEGVETAIEIQSPSPERDASTPEGGRMDQHPSRTDLGMLQPKPRLPSSTEKPRKRLKTPYTRGQARASLKTPTIGSGVLASTPGLDSIPAVNPVQQTPHLIEAMLTEISLDEISSTSDPEGVESEIFCLEAMFPEWKEYTTPDPLMVYKATSDPDTMYHHEAMMQPDRKKFQEAMSKELKDQMDNGNFTIMKRTDVPKDKTILPAVWQMKRKRDIKTREVKKYKARLNIDGSRMQKGIHYDQTYAPVAQWKSIRLLLIMVVKHGWCSKQLDYVLAFPQAPVEKEIYMEIPRGCEMTRGQSKDHVLKLHRNVYGQKQAGRVWNKYLVDKLVNKLGFTQSKIDECVFYRGKTMYVLYTDDSLLAGPDQKEIDQIVIDLQAAKLNITDEGNIEDFLGINIDIKKDGTVHLTQPHLIDQILEDLDMVHDTLKPKDIPACSSKLLKRDLKGEKFDRSFHYRSVIGKLNYLEKGTRSDISYITHQCARFVEDPRQCHGRAIRHLARYLKGTKDKGLILKPKKGKGLEVYVDADFSGNWDPSNPGKDRDTARSRHGYIVMYDGCPVIWKSQLQTEIALSSTESEYIGLSYALREVIPITGLLKEMRKNNFPMGKTTPKIKCAVFEDNSGALEMANTHKYRPRTKHLNVKLHHFRDYVARGEITIHKINTLDQLADYLTKPVNEEILLKLREEVMGW